MEILAGRWKGRKIKTPKELTTRPTQSVVRGAVFNICQGCIENVRFLDCFAGSGAMGLEALSRGASHASFIEKNVNALKTLRENIHTLGAENETTVYSFPVEKALSKIHSPFDIVYLDPPYDLSVTPLLIELMTKKLVKEGGLVFVEERFDPKKKEKPIQVEGLEHKNCRRFGIALLHQYSVVK